MTNEAGRSGQLTHLRCGGVSVVLDSRSGALPAVLYWGADLGDLRDDEVAELEFAGRAPVGDSRIDVPERVSVLPSSAEGWVGRPGIVGSRRGAAFSPLLVLDGQDPIDPSATIAAGCRYRLTDGQARLGATVEIELAHSGLLRVRASLTNLHPDHPYGLESLTVALPVPAIADELLDLTGRHTRERAPQRTAFTVGTRLRESRQGKPGLDAATLLAAGASGFGFTGGEVWGLHLGWSGNQLMYAERLYNGQRVLGAGELILAGEVALEPGETYTAPWLYAAYGDGLTALSGRFHDYLRSRPTHPRSRRPVLVNTWEAVYFGQNLDALVGLARAAAEVGVERFVLDDGWFRHRRNDHAGLGDWYVDDTVWPDGLMPLIDQVHALGMDFGLWVEPEMINLDSDLARAHPEWIFRAGGRVGIPSRQQYVLDLGHTEAYDYIWQRLTALLDTYPIAYLKWDHNRMVVEAGHGPDGVPGVRRHTLAVYCLLDALRDRYPHLEIETCAGGGGRIDLGILERTDRVWPSDCIDALERQQIQRYTQLLLPPELIGTHIGAPTAHTTHRTLNMGLRGGHRALGSHGHRVGPQQGF